MLLVLPATVFTAAVTLWIGGVGRGSYSPKCILNLASTCPIRSSGTCPSHCSRRLTVAA